MYKLREYQSQALDALDDKYASGKKRVILVAPTGSGKTVMAVSFMCKMVFRTGRQVLFLAHRKELVTQANKKLHELGVPTGIIMSGVKPDVSAPIQVASVQTIVRRSVVLDVGLIVVDECHHAASSTYQKIIAKYPTALILGLTATPYRADGKGLGDTFQDWVRAAGIEPLTDMGFLAPARYWSPCTQDLRFDIRGKEFDTESAGKTMSKPSIIGDVVHHYKQIAFGKKFICFAVNKLHGEKIAEGFNEAGICTDFLHDGIGKVAREQMLANHRVGRLTGLVNVGILSEGYDDPTVHVCIQARPTMSLGLHIQQIGRVLRPHDDKQYAIIIDHAGNCRRLGLMADYEVKLSSGLDKRHIRGVGDIAPSLKTCTSCFAVFPSACEKCPLCGKLTAKHQRTIIQKDGTLKEITKPACPCGSFDTVKRASSKGTVLACAQCGKELKIIMATISGLEYYLREYRKCLKNGWKPFRADILYKNRYGRYPDREMRNKAREAC